MQPEILHLTPGGPRWPDRFACLAMPPADLWVRGQVECLAPRRSIAIVGSRAPSAYGLDQARRFAGHLAARGITVVSGMARGIDQAAHSGALACGGPTIAVLGSAVDRPWPGYDRLPELLEHGLIVSEFAPGQGPRRHHFPLRNRLIAALADAVLVIEAAHASGSLISAHWAVELGREVFALPGRVDHPMAQGTLRLLREGARAVGSAAQILTDLGWAGPVLPTDENEALPTEPDAAAIVRALTGETLDIQELSRRLDRSVPELLGQLCHLQLGGWIARGPGGLYRRLEQGPGPEP
ncbi:MAG: DNA-processing protein DprA [Planctomycetota bacterium]